MSKQIFVSDVFKATSSRTVTDEGYLVVPGKIARTGVQDYYAYELGLERSLGAMHKISLYRPEEEVFSHESMSSFDGCPVTIGHPVGGVDKKSWSKLSKGDVRDVKKSGEYMEATLTIKSEDAIEAVNNGTKELSNGYKFTLDMTPGTTPSGEKYDGVQRNIRGNHVALVEVARCGSACRVSDSQTTHLTKGNKTMSEVTQKVVVDGIPVEVSDAAAAVIKKLQDERDVAVSNLKAAPNQAAIDGLAKEVSTLKISIAAKDAEIEALKKDVVTPADRDAMVAEWSSLILDAKRLIPNLLTDGKTCHALRKEVIAGVQDEGMKAVVKAIIGDKQPTELDEATARTAFAAISAIPKQIASDGATASALLGGTGSTAVVDARTLWANNLNT